MDSELKAYLDKLRAETRAVYDAWNKRFELHAPPLANLTIGASTPPVTRSAVVASDGDRTVDATTVAAVPDASSSTAKAQETFELIPAASPAGIGMVPVTCSTEFSTQVVTVTNVDEIHGIATMVHSKPAVDFIHQEAEQLTPPVGTNTTSAAEVVPPVATTFDIDPKAGVQVLGALSINTFSPAASELDHYTEPEQCPLPVSVQIVMNNTSMFHPDATPSWMVLRPKPWPSFWGENTDGNATRPMPWPSFTCCHELRLKHIGLPSQVTYVLTHSSGNLNFLRESLTYMLSSVATSREDLHPEELQWQPWRPPCRVGIRHKRSMFRPIPWPSFDCFHEGTQLTYARPQPQVTSMMKHFSSALNSLRESLMMRYQPSVQPRAVHSSGLLLLLFEDDDFPPVPCCELIPMEETFSYFLGTQLQSWRPPDRSTSDAIQLSREEAIHWEQINYNGKAVNWQSLQSCAYYIVQPPKSANCWEAHSLFMEPSGFSLEKLWGQEIMCIKSQSMRPFVSIMCWSMLLYVVLIHNADSVQILSMSVHLLFLSLDEFQGDGCFPRDCSSEQFGDPCVLLACLMVQPICCGEQPFSYLQGTHQQAGHLLDRVPYIAEHAKRGSGVIHTEQVNYKGVQFSPCCLVQPQEGGKHFIHCETAYGFYLELLALVGKVWKSDHYLISHLCVVQCHHLLLGSMCSTPSYTSHVSIKCWLEQQKEKAYSLLAASELTLRPMYMRIFQAVEIFREQLSLLQAQHLAPINFSTEFRSNLRINSESLHITGLHWEFPQFWVATYDISTSSFSRALMVLLFELPFPPCTEVTDGNLAAYLNSCAANASGNCIHWICFAQLEKLWPTGTQEEIFPHRWSTPLSSVFHGQWDPGEEQRYSDDISENYGNLLVFLVCVMVRPICCCDLIPIEEPFSYLPGAQQHSWGPPDRVTDIAEHAKRCSELIHAEQVNYAVVQSYFCCMMKQLEVIEMATNFRNMKLQMPRPEASETCECQHFISTKAYHPLCDYFEVGSGTAYPQSDEDDSVQNRLIPTSTCCRRSMKVCVQYPMLIWQMVNGGLEQANAKQTACTPMDSRTFSRREECHPCRAVFTKGSDDHEYYLGFDHDGNDNAYALGAFFHEVSTGREFCSVLVEAYPDFGYCHDSDQDEEHQVPWDPGGSQWHRLGVKPSFKEGGMLGAQCNLHVYVGLPFLPTHGPGLAVRHLSAARYKRPAKEATRGYPVDQRTRRRRLLFFLLLPQFMGID